MPSHEATSSVNDEQKQELLVGACELGLLEATWERFVNKPQYQYLFVIDAPKISSVHALPPYNIAHFGLTGFLPVPERPADLRRLNFAARQKHFEEQARGFPLALGLTEILARYLLTTRWSGGAPKLMLSSQTTSVVGILEAITRNSSAELSQTIGNIGVQNPLTDLAKRFFADKVTKADQFIDKVTNELETLLPAIYGAYTATRQLFRYSEALPFPDEREEEKNTVFAHSYKVIADILNQAARETNAARSLDLQDSQSHGATTTGTPTFPTLLDAWTKAVPPSGLRASNDSTHNDDDDERSESSNAHTLAEIEYINTYLAKSNSTYRLVFVTTTGRLFEAALKRFNVRPLNVRPKFGARSNFDKSEYLSRLLSCCEGNDQLGAAPLLDPRVLMCSPDFVNFANHQSKTSVDDQSRAISAWVPAFFGNFLHGSGGLDHARLYRTYLHYQTSRQTRDESNVISISAFTNEQFLGLKESWNNYIRIVAAAEGVDRLMRREAFHDIRQMLLTKEGQKATLSTLIGKRIDDAMSKWLTVVGGNALQANLAKLEKAGGSANIAKVFRIVPPVILPSFGEAQVSIFELVAQLCENGRNVNLSQFSWLTNPTASEFGIDDTAANKIHKIRYVQMLGQAVMFASLGRWDASYRLVTQAFALAEQFLRVEADRAEPKYISGREAAYFASVACRRRASSSNAAPALKEGREWVAKYREAIKLESNYLAHHEPRLFIHDSRAELEGIAWDAFGVLYILYLNDSIKDTSAVNLGWIDQCRDLCKALLARFSGDSEHLFTSTIDFGDDCTSKAYNVALAYLQRQLAIMALQIELLLCSITTQATNDSIKSYLALIDRSNNISADSYQRKYLPFSTLEHAVLNAARRVARLPLIDDKLPEFSGEENAFDRWRIEKLVKLASS
jgi:hypothetical protein